MEGPPTELPWARAAYEHLLGADPAMAALARRRGLLARTLTRDYFAHLVRAIVAQQISGQAAASIYRRLAERAGDPPIPQALAALADDEIRGCGVSGAKLLALRDLAARALDGRLDLPHLDTLPDEEIVAQLVAVRGIGRWTAQMFLMFALGRPDVLPAEDLGIQNAVKHLFRLEEHPKPATVRLLAETGRWHPYATAACFYLWESLSER